MLLFGRFTFFEKQTRMESRQAASSPAVVRMRTVFFSNTASFSSATSGSSSSTSFTVVLLERFVLKFSVFFVASRLGRWFLETVRGSGLEFSSSAGFRGFSGEVGGLSPTRGFS